MINDCVYGSRIQIAFHERTFGKLGVYFSLLWIDIRIGFQMFHSACYVNVLWESI